MGHGQNAENKDLGLGWLYYALARIHTPTTAICIGSWRGFVPILLGRAIKDNNNGGRVIFIDPSLADDHWQDPDRTQEWFSKFELSNIEHHRMTTQEFVLTDHFRELSAIDLLFIDGMHTAEQARFDYESFDGKMNDQSIALFHDSFKKRYSRIYDQDNPYLHTVTDYINELDSRNDLQVMDFPLASSVTLVRKNLRHG